MWVILIISLGIFLIDDSLPGNHIFIYVVFFPWNLPFGLWTSWQLFKIYASSSLESFLCPYPKHLLLTLNLVSPWLTGLWVALRVNKRVCNAVLGCNLKNDRMISVYFQSKPFNITVIQVYAPTSNVEQAEAEWFYEDLQDLLEPTPKKDVISS